MFDTADQKIKLQVKRYNNSNNNNENGPNVFRRHTTKTVQ